MTLIPTIAANDTFGVWQGRINQVINVVGQLTDGTLFVNGSIIFSNSTFSLSLPSMNVANNLVLTSGSGNTFFLQSSNAVINGTMYLTGSGNALYVSNNAIIKNLNVLQISTLNSVNANTISSTVLFDNQQRVLTSFNVSTTNGLTGGTTITGPGGNITLSQTLVDNTISTITNQAATANAVNAVHSLALIKNTGGQINTANGSWSSSNYGKHLSLISSSVNPAIGISDSTGSNFWAMVNQAGVLKLARMPAISDSATAPTVIKTFTNTGETLTGDSTITGNVIVSADVQSATGHFTNILTANSINTQNEVISTLGSISQGQFRAVFGSTAALFRNDGTNAHLLTTGITATPYTSTFNSLRPFSFDMINGKVTIDATSSGTIFGGAVTLPTLAVGSPVTINSGVTISPTTIILPNGNWLYGKDTSGNPRALIGTDTLSHTAIFAGSTGLLRFLNQAGNIAFGQIDATGSLAVVGSIFGQNHMASVNNGGFYGKDTSNVQRPMMVYGTDNIANLYAGTNYWRILRWDGATELFKVDNSGNSTVMGNIQVNSYFSCGAAAVNGTPGTIQANNGYECKAGQFGGFRPSVFNIDWNGAASAIYIDNTLVATFPFGTNTSDVRLKRNIHDAPLGALVCIRNLHEVIFQFQDNNLIKNYDKEHLGYLAHELQEYIPQAVYGEKDAVDEDGEIVPQNLNQLAIIAKTTQAISELADMYDDLANKYNELEKRITLLENK